MLIVCALYAALTVYALFDPNATLVWAIVTGFALWLSREE